MCGLNLNYEGTTSWALAPGPRDRLQAVLDEYAARPPVPGGRKVAGYLDLYTPPN